MGLTNLYRDREEEDMYGICLTTKEGLVYIVQASHVTE